MAIASVPGCMIAVVALLFFYVHRRLIPICWASDVSDPASDCVGAREMASQTIDIRCS